jgi:hypothetical protein
VSLRGVPWAVGVREEAGVNPLTLIQRIFPVREHAPFEWRERELLIGPSNEGWDCRTWGCIPDSTTCVYCQEEGA